MDRVKAILQNPEPARWLFYGDSITHGAKHTEGRRDFTEHFRERVIWELQRSRDLVLNSAHSGFKTTELLRDFEWRAAAFRPTVAFIMIGTNDSAANVSPEEFASFSIPQEPIYAILLKCFFASSKRAMFGITCPAVPPPVNTIVFITLICAEITLCIPSFFN